MIAEPPSLRALVLVEMTGDGARPTWRSAVALVQQLGLPFDALICARTEPSLAEVGIQGAERVLLWVHPDFEPGIADRFAAAVAHLVGSTGSALLLAAASDGMRDVLPRAAALLDRPMLTDVSGWEGHVEQPAFVRPLGGNGVFGHHAVCLRDGVVLSVRPCYFPSGAAGEGSPAIVRIHDRPPVLARGILRVESRLTHSDRPALADAKVVVAGGRPVGGRQQFDALVGGLADALGGAVGSTKACVDAGYAESETLIGQTGAVISPDLYIAAGISGADQHVAGVKDARTIVAINRDPEAPLCRIADYVLVGDMFDLLPQLAARIKKAHDSPG